MSHIAITQPSSSSIETFDIGPITIRVLEDGSHTEDHATDVIYTIPPHVTSRLPLQHNHHDETFFILHGTLRIGSASRSFDETTGSFVTVPKGELYSVKNLGEEYVEILATSTSDGYLEYLRSYAKGTKREGEEAYSMENMGTSASGVEGSAAAKIDTEKESEQEEDKKANRYVISLRCMA
jgi:mannose-6-phosphate isomerase-like protein (cupin superfamily)